MANYMCASRSNYFRVTDEDAYAKIFERLVCAEGEVYDFSEEADDGRIEHGFGAYSMLEYIPEDQDPADEDVEHESVGGFLEAIAPILEDGQVAVAYEAGNEKLRYVTGMAWIIAKDQSLRYMSIDSWAKAQAEDMVGVKDIRDSY